MSDLILSWLNQEVGLSKKVKAFERDFSNGYLFGELLHKFGYIADFEENFIDEGSLSAKRDNFRKLAAVFRGPAGDLGVRLKPEMVQDMIQEDRGSSLRLLYQLRKGLLQRGQGGLVRRKGVAVPMQAKVSRGDHAERFFDEKLGTLSRHDPRVGHEVNTKQFVDEHTTQIRTAADLEQEAKQDTKDRVTEHRKQRLDAMADKKATYQRTLAEGQATWHSVQSKKAENVQTDLRFEKEMIRREREKIERVRERHRQETGYSKEDDNSGIHWFERNLARIGIDTSEHGGSTGTATEVSSLKELYEKMHEKLPTQAQLQVEASKRMKKIRETKRATDVARKERERRQHRMHVEQQATQVIVEEQRKEEDQLAWLLQVTVDYRREAAAFDHAQRAKEAARAEREARQMARAEKSAQEMEEAYSRTAARAREERELQQTERARLRGTSAQSAEAAQEDMSSDDEDVELSMPSADGKASPMRSLEVSANRLGTGDGLEAAVALQGSVASATSSIASAQKLMDCVQEPRMSDYIFARGEWTQHQPSEEEVARLLAEQGEHLEIAQQPRLGGLVRWLCAPAEPAVQERAHLPTELLPIVALGGAPNGLGECNAAAVARKLCNELELTLLEPQKVLGECLALFNKDPQEPEWPVLARVHQLGKRLSELGADAATPPALIAEALFRKIELLWAPPPKPVEEEEVPAKGKKPPPKKKGAVEEEGPPPKPKGIVIVGFPVDFGQQVALEAALRGYTSPILRIQNGEEDQHLQVSSMIAPWWVEADSARDQVQSFAEEEEEDDGAAAGPVAAGLVAAGESAPLGSLQILRLEHKDRMKLVQAVVAEAANEGAWETAAAARAAEAEAGGGEAQEIVPLCQGYDSEVANLSCPVDRVWLYQEAQIFSQAFAAPLNTFRDVAIVEEEGSELSPAEALYQQVRDFAAAWRRRASEAAASEAEARATARAAAAAAEAEAAAAAAGGAAEAAEGGGEGAATAAKVAEEGAAAMDPLEEGDEEEENEDHAEAKTSAGLKSDSPWPCISTSAQARMRQSWLESLSSYYLGVQSTLGEVQDALCTYSNEVVALQRRFLEFVQRGDEKASIFDDFCKTTLQKPGRPTHEDSIMEQIEELSDRLWTLADRRRAESVEERGRLMTGGFWESQAAVAVRLAEKLQASESERFSTSVALLSEAFDRPVPMEAASTVLASSQAAGGGPNGEPSTLEELRAALDASAARFAGGALLAEIAAAARAGAEEEEEMEEGGEEAGARGVAIQELYGAVRAEQQGHARRLKAIAAWTMVRLEAMRTQLDEVFRRMDDWIRDRVKTENNAIKAAVANLQQTGLQTLLEDVTSPTYSTKSTGRMRSKSTPKSKFSLLSPSSVHVRGPRREFLKNLEPRTLDVEVLQPPKPDGRLASPSPAQQQQQQQQQQQTSAQGGLQLPLQGAYSRASRVGNSLVPGGMGVSQERWAPGSMGVSQDRWPQDRWPQEMLCNLMRELFERCNGAAAVSQDALLDVLSLLRSRTLSMEAECVPKAWASRTEGAWTLFCQALVSPAWGVAAVDVTELLLDLTFHGRQLSRPSLEALEATRKMVESEDSGLAESQRACYPDVPVSEELFLRLPLWDGSVPSRSREEPASEHHENLLRWIFRVLRCFESEANPQLLTVPGRQRADGSSGAISARRMFTYLGLGMTPAEGLQRALRLLMPPPPAAPAAPDSEETEADGEVKPPDMRVQEVSNVLFSCGGGRPAGAVAPAPELMDLCKQLLPQLYDKEAFLAAQEAAAAAADPKGKAKAKAKAKGKEAAAAPEEENEVPPPPPEEAVISMAEAEVLRHPAILRGLFSHGGVLCRKRGIGILFPEGGSAAAGLAGPAPVPAEVAARLAALDSSIPPEAEASRAPSPEAPP